MNQKTSLAVILFVGVIVLGALFSSGAFKSDKTTTKKIQGVEKADIVLHKSPTCGCCGAYTSYIKRLSYNVEVHDTEDLSSIKSDLKVPSEVESCHTMEIALPAAQGTAQARGYVVEGHIPEEAIQKLLSEKPDIRGIGMGGMPQGSPGMPGPKTSDFVIYEINNDGTRGEIFVTI